MENNNVQKEEGKKSKSKLIIIILLAIIVIGVGVTVFFLMTDKSFSDVKEMFQSKDEYTVLLDEFVMNLQTEQQNKNYLKVEVALMYTDSDFTELVEASNSKIRDIVLNDLREKTPRQMSEVDKTPELKEDLKGKINEALGEDVIEEVYFTNLIVQ